MNMAASKLKQGYGEGVCAVLLKLCMVSVTNKVKFKKPVIREEGAGLEDDGEDVNGDDMDGRADLADVIHAHDSEEDIDDDVDFGGGAVHNDLAKKMEEDNAANAIIHSAISKEKWQLEVERVGHKLKVNQNAGDSKEWRSHLDQTKKYADQVKQSLPDVRYKLEKLQEESTKTLGRISR